VVNEPGQCFIGFIRHGERADHVPDCGFDYDVATDPPLTREGLK